MATYYTQTEKEDCAKSAYEPPSSGGTGKLITNQIEAQKKHQAIMNNMEAKSDTSPIAKDKLKKTKAKAEKQKMGGRICFCGVKGCGIGPFVDTAED